MKNHEHMSIFKIMISRMKLTMLVSLMSLVVIGQTGINYKALIKDANANVIANRSIDIVFSIQHENVTQYSELQQIVTDNNGIAIATIGEGSAITNTFDAIDWKLRQLELNVQIDLGDGLVDFGNSHFNAVPYAINILKPQGMEAIDEGNGIGWRLVGRDTSLHGAIGENAVDLSYNTTDGILSGATGENSFASGLAARASGTHSIAIGLATEASESSSIAMGYFTDATGFSAVALGAATVASGNSSIAMGSATTASGFAATSMGENTQAIGDHSTALGISTRAEALNSTAIGRYNVGGGDSGTWANFDPLFEIGNGSSNSNRSNALTVQKNGEHIINSQSTGLSISALLSGVRINGGTIGVVVSNSEFEGGSFSGFRAGISTTSLNPDNPDIILRGNSNSNAEDDGIITSDPNYSGSDIYLRSNDAVVIELDNDDNSSGSFFVRNGDNTNVFTVNESGNAILSGSLTQNSDRRLKQDIGDLPYGLNEILQLQPKQYFWKNHEREKKSLGLIAQDVLPIINEIVNIQDDELKTLGISYTELIPVLINAIKEQQKIIDNQSEDLMTSKNNYEAMLSRIEILESKSSN